MSKDKVVLVVGGGFSYYLPFTEYGEYCDDLSILARSPERVILGVFTGGHDVSPEFYGEESGSLNSCSRERDIKEKHAFSQITALKIPIAGICRGSQFLCAMSGGKLAQHVINHTRDHNIETKDGRTIHVTSTHHQMQLPPKDAELIAWATPKLSKFYLGAHDKQLPPPEREAEIVYYPANNALAMQYHPEMMGEKTEGFQLCKELTEKYLLQRN